MINIYAYTQRQLSLWRAPVVFFTMVLLVIACSSNTPTSPSANQNGNADAPVSVVDPADQDSNQNTVENDPVDEPDENEPVQTPLPTTDVASMLPRRDTVFGEPISTFPNPNQLLGEDLLIWRYRIVNDQLVAEDHDAPLSHQLVWQRYAELIPYEYRKRLLQVSFEIDPTPNPNASNAIINGNFFGTTPGVHESWLYIREPVADAYFNAHQRGETPNRYFYSSLFIHEQGHVLHNDFIVNRFGLDESELYLTGPAVRRDSLMARYYENFWFNGVYQFWLANAFEPGSTQKMLDKYPDLFVSRYATSNVMEDFAESFKAFVEIDDIPSSGKDYSGAEKVLWFWKQPEYVLLRDHIRSKLLQNAGDGLF